MKEINRYYPDTKKIKKIFKLFPEPDRNLIRYNHNLWPHYYRDDDILITYTKLIETRGCNNITHELIEKMYDSLYDLRKIMSIKFEKLRIKNENKNELINAIHNLLTNKQWFFDFNDIKSLFYKYYEYTDETFVEIYFIYCIIIYCPEEAKILFENTPLIK